jgi:hypothetical protein
VNRTKGAPDDEKGVQMINRRMFLTGCAAAALVPPAPVFLGVDVITRADCMADHAPAEGVEEISELLSRHGWRVVPNLRQRGRHRLDDRIDPLTPGTRPGRGGPARGREAAKQGILGERNV